MRDGKMMKVDPKLLLILGSITLLVNHAHGYMEAIPLPKVLDECFKTESKHTNIRNLAGEELHTSCMYAWEIHYNKYHCCERNISSIPLNRWKNPQAKPLPKTSRTGNTGTTQGDGTIRRKYTKRGVEHRRYRRAITPDQILIDLIQNYKDNKNMIRRKRWTEKKIRKEYRMLTRTERMDYHKAINMLKETSHTINFDYISLFHTGDTLSKAHRGPAFPSWHRLYLLYYELLLDYFVPGVALPYWDSSIDKEMADPAKCIMWTDEFVGNGFGVVNTGPFKNWYTANGDGLIRNLGNGERLIHKDNVTLIWEQGSHRDILLPTGTDYRWNFEIQHNGPHRQCGGHMASLHTAAMDPVFFMHHCYMDYIWEVFRQRIRTRNINPETDYPVGDYDLLNALGQLPHQPMARFTSLTNIDGFSDFWTEFYYTYQDHPTCDANKECGSPYYECLRPLNRCTSVTEAALNTPSTATNVATEMVALAAGPPPPPNLHTQQKQFLNDIKTLSVANPLSIAAAAMSFSPPSLRLEVDKDLRSSCLGETIQNTFTIDCESDVDKWAFFPVQIIHLRTGTKKYNEQIIKKNKAQRGFDMFSPKNYAKLERLVGNGNPARFASCFRLKAGANKIYIQSHGLNYQGEYNEYAFIDERNPISSTIGYTAIKKPSKGSVEAYIAAMDSCGRLCKPWCLVKGSKPPRYERCTGAIRVSKKHPLMYGNTYGDAILDHWKLDDPNDLPLVSHKGVFMIFYCDYKETWPW